MYIKYKQLSHIYGSCQHRLQVASNVEAGQAATLYYGGCQFRKLAATYVMTHVMLPYNKYNIGHQDVAN